MGIDLVDPDDSVRDKPGDAVEVAGTWPALPIHGSLILEELEAPDMSRMLSRRPGWPKPKNPNGRHALGRRCRVGARCRNEGRRGRDRRSGLDFLTKSTGVQRMGHR